MKSKLLNQEGGERTFAITFDAGEELIEGMRRFAREEELAASEFRAIGAFAEATVAYFDWDQKEYRGIPIGDQVELLSLIGHVTLPHADEEAEERNLHVHVVLGRADGSAVGGHLQRAVVRPTCEIVLNELPAYLARRTDPESGLALIDPDIEATSGS